MTGDAPPRACLDVPSLTKRKIVIARRVVFVHRPAQGSADEGVDGPNAGLVAYPTAHTHSKKEIHS